MSCSNIFFDHGTTTYVRPEVLAKMLPHFGQSYAEPSALYGMARISGYTLSNARKTVMECINAESEDTILFTSGGTQSNNFALCGIAEAYKNKGNHIIVAKTEHISVINVCKYLENNGFCVTFFYHSILSRQLLQMEYIRTSFLLSCSVYLCCFRVV